MKHSDCKAVRNAKYYDMNETFIDLYKRSQNGESFECLFELIFSKNNIKLAYRNIKENAGSKTSGVDGKTIQDVAELSEDEIVRKVLNLVRNYQPKAVRRFEISKLDGKSRLLGIPTIWDRIIQQCFKQVLEPICEAKFSEHSYGSRPCRSVENAMADVYKKINQQHLRYVIDFDIENFFDNVDHHRLVQSIWKMGIHDTRVIQIIKKMCKARIKLPDGNLEVPTKGIIQGGILSPLLANIYLDNLDKRIEGQWETFKTKIKYSDNSSRWRSLRSSGLKEMFIVRYGDDFKIFCAKEDEAVRTKNATEKWLMKNLKLDVSPEKTKITDLTKGYSEFLGFKFKMVKKGTRYVVASHISDKSMKQIQEKIKFGIKKMKFSGKLTRPQAIQRYNSLVRGIHNYFQIATCVSLDLNKLALSSSRSIYARLRATKGQMSPKCADYKKYGKSKQLRFVGDNYILPIGFIKKKDPMFNKKGTTIYTLEGQKILSDKEDDIRVRELQKHMLENPVTNRSVEFNDCRQSLVSKQKGKDPITGEALEIDDFHTHHIVPRKDGGQDEFKNLIIISQATHRLIHATNKNIIKKRLEELHLDDNQLKKLNLYRKKANNFEINKKELESNSLPVTEY